MHKMLNAIKEKNSLNFNLHFAGLELTHDHCYEKFQFSQTRNEELSRIQRENRGLLSGKSKRILQHSG